MKLTHVNSPLMTTLDQQNTNAREKHLDLKLTSHFSKLSLPEGNLFLRGHFNVSPQDLARRLETQTQLEEIKGNFAAVLQSSTHGTIAIVDHLCTFPIFYSAQSLTTIFAKIASENQEENVLGTEAVDLIGGHSVGSITNRKGVSRLMPGHVLYKGQQKKYLDIYAALHTQEENTDFLKQTIEDVCLENVADDNILLMSAGRDSVTIAGVLKKLKVLDKFKIISIYSGIQPSSEIESVRRIAADMDLNVHYHRQDLVFDLSEEDELRQGIFWRDGSFPLKKLAVRKFVKTGTRIWHGEIGDQLFGGPKDSVFLKLLNQVPDMNVDRVVDL